MSDLDLAELRAEADALIAADRQGSMGFRPHEVLALLDRIEALEAKRVLMYPELDELRRIAEAATPGPWEPWEIYPLVSPTRVDGFVHPEIRSQEQARIKADETHIAAFDPPTVLALLDRIEALEAEAKSARDLIAAIADELTPGRRDKDLVIAARETHAVVASPEFQSIIRAAQADAWDEAYQAGVEDQWTSEAMQAGVTPNRINPYRQESSDEH